MPQNFDLQKYIDFSKLYFQKCSGALCSFVREKTPIIQDFFKTHKEIILKLSFPIFLILVCFCTCTSSQRTISRNIDDLFEISDEIRGHYADRPGYWGLSTDFILANNIISNKFIHNGKILLSGGEAIFIGSGIDANAVMPGMSSFDIVLSKLNKAQCISYAEKNISPDNLVKLQRIQISNQTGDYSFEWGGSNYKLPISKYATKDICINDENTLIWTFN